MKTLFTKAVVSLALLTCVAVAPAGAALIDRGSFADGVGGFMNLIYDDDLNITWLGDANFSQTSGFDGDGLMTWTVANNSWAPGLMVGGFTDWRLPTTTQPDATCSLQNFPAPGQSSGTGCTGSEMGHLFHVEGITTATPAVFANVQSNLYWSGTEFVANPNGAWYFVFNNGNQNINFKIFSFFGWAVRSGDVSATTPPPAVPEPSTILLLGSGLVGLIGWQRARRGLMIG